MGLHIWVEPGEQADALLAVARNYGLHAAWGDYSPPGPQGPPVSYRRDPVNPRRMDGDLYEDMDAARRDAVLRMREGIYRRGEQDTERGRRVLGSIHDFLQRETA